MPDDNCDTDQPQTLSNARNLKWREKLLAINRIARTTKPTEKLELDTNIADFLGNSAQSARKASITGSGHESDSSSTATNIVGGPSDKNALITQTLHLPYARQITSRRRRREGPPLQVRFTDAEPELIGEGGDEALLPSAEVTKSWLVLAKTSQSSEVKTLWDSKYSNSDGRNLEDPVYQSSVGVQSGSANNGALKQSIASSCQNTSQQCRASWSSGASHEAHQRLPTPPPSGLEVSSRHKDDELWISRVRPKVEPDIEANLDTPSHRLPADTYATTPRRPSPSTQPDPSAEKIRNRHPSPLQSANTTGASRTSYTELISPYPSDLRELSSKLENGSRPENALEEVITGEGVDDFHSRVQHLRSIFRLATDASRHTPAGFSEWLTIAKWWFLRGRIAIEKVTHAIGQNFQALQEIQNGNIPLPLKQAFVDLAKAWWIAKEVMPELNQSVSSDGGRLAASEISLPEDYHGLLASMRALSKSMVKGHILPPTMFLAQGVDTMVWIHYTDLAPNLAYLLSGTASKKVLQQHNPGEVETDLIIPLSDTEQHFIYGRMFVDIEVVSNNESPVGRLPCLISILRRRTSYDVEIILASQDSRIRLHVQSEKRKGPTWSDVQWKRKSSCILIHLAPEMDIMVRMGEHDFRNLWGIYDYANRLTSNWEAQKDENLTFDHVSRLFHKVNSSHPESEFPTRPLRHCRIRLFCKRTAAPDGTGSQVSHDENRLVIMTPPSNRTLSSINQPLGLNTPLFFDYLRGEDDAPALSLYLSGVNKGTKPTMIVTFDQASTRAKLHSQLDGSFVSSYETASREILIRGFMTSRLTPVRPPHQDILKFPEGIEWQHVRVIRPEADKKDESFLSDRVRVCVHSSYGNVTDRICLGPGELQMNLSAKSLNTASFYRPAQNKLTISFAKTLVSLEATQLLSQTLNEVTSAPCSRLYRFNSLKDLHTFQQLVTGFSVHFDGLASNFAISRRRMMVPIHKKLETSLARVQVIGDGKTTQLVAFFDDFSLGACMNFVVKTTDVFESLARSGRFFVRLVDAKFALPADNEDGGGGDDPLRGFVCLDIPDYPGEHDDIMIGFDSEEERDRFGAALPGVVGKSSRLGALRR